MCDALVNLVGPTLTTKEGSEATSKLLDGVKAVALYFSAHWCPPCRGFTPQLAESYTTHLKKKGLEIIFVSSDRDEESFKEYFAEQPWLALPFESRDLKAKLSKKFKVSGIPSLVILDGETGETITTDGRECVSEDPEGKKFPWKPPSFFEALGDDFLKGTEGDSVSLAEIRSDGAKYIGLYFSAHWCPPCRGFTPTLVSAYESHLKAKGLEIIFVSSDRDQASFLEYFGSMPWLAIPNGDERKGALSKRFGVSGIPSLVVVDAQTGETLSPDARGAVSADPTGEELPWRPKPLKNLSAGEGVDGINDEAALVVLLEGCDAETAAEAKRVLTAFADARHAAGDPTLIFYAPNGQGPVEQIRKLTHLTPPAADTPAAPQVLLLDIPDEGGFYTAEGTALTADALGALLDAHKAGTLERKQLQ